MSGNLFGSGKDISKVSMAVASAGRGSHCNEHSVGLLHCRSIVQGEGKAACLYIPQNQIIKTRLVNRDNPLLKGFYTI